MSAKDEMHKRQLLTLPNMISLLRIIMAAAAAVLFGFSSHALSAAFICLLATILDAVDGWAARRLSQCSVVGGWVDPIADKILIAVIFTVIAVNIPYLTVRVLFAAIMVREAFITIFRISAKRQNSINLPSNAAGKWKMMSQGIFGNAILIWGVLVEFDIAYWVVLSAFIITTLLSYTSLWLTISRYCREKTKRAVFREGLLENAEEESARMIAGK